jgi:hypothetical protein
MVQVPAIAATAWDEISGGVPPEGVEEGGVEVSVVLAGGVEVSVVLAGGVEVVVVDVGGVVVVAPGAAWQPFWVQFALVNPIAT